MMPINKILITKAFTVTKMDNGKNKMPSILKEGILSFI